MDRDREVGRRQRRERSPQQYWGDDLDDEELEEKEGEEDLVLDWGGDWEEDDELEHEYWSERLGPA